jgi:hypothetical protein
MAAEKSLDVPTPMNFPSVPQRDNRSSQMTEKLAEKRDDLGARDVVHVEIEVQPETTAPRGHGQRRDDGDPATSVAMPQVRRVAEGRRGLTNVRSCHTDTTIVTSITWV